MKNKTLAALEIGVVLCLVLVTASAITSASEFYVPGPLDVFGNANEDDTIDMRDLTFTARIILRLEDETDFADANYDGRVSVADMTQIGLIILGRESKLTLLDQIGRAVTITRPTDRIVTLPIPLASMVYAIDGKGDRIVGMHPVSMKAIEEGILGEMCPELKLASIDFVTSGFEVNVEELLKLEPDVVFQWGFKGEGLYKPMEDAGIGVICLNYGTQEDLDTWLTILGVVLRKEEKALGLIESQHEVIQEIADETSSIPEAERPKVLYLPYGVQLRTTGTGTYNQFWIDTTGGLNVAKELDGWKSVNMEQIYDWNPDIIYLGNFADNWPDELLENKISGQDWSKLEAVKNGKVYKVPLGGYRWDPPNQESHLMLKWLVEVHHPELFDYDVREEIKVFYSDFYGYAVSDEQVSQILHCDNNQGLPCCKIS
jgi:iron complex transport system substrate-binding protein